MLRGVEMSGFGAPFSTATPMPELAIGVFVPSITLPLLIRLSMPAGVLTSKSAASPSVTRFAMAPDGA